MSDDSIIKKITLPDGFRVGIKHLDKILNEVAGLKLTEKEAIKEALLEGVKKFNYVASKVEREYADVMYEEYRRKFDEKYEAKTSYTQHKHTAG